MRFGSKYLTLLVIALNANAFLSCSDEAQSFVVDDPDASGSETDTDEDTETVTEFDTDTDTEMDTDSETGADSDTDADADTDVDADTDGDSDTDTATETDSGGDCNGTEYVLIDWSGATLSGPMQSITTPTSPSMTYIFTTTANAGRATIEAEFACTGDWYLWGYANIPGNHNTFRIGLNDNQLVVWEFEKTEIYQWQWNAFEYNDNAAFPISKGAHTLTVAGGETSASFNYASLGTLLFVTNPAFDPTN